MNYELSFQKKSGGNAYKCKYCNTTNNSPKEIKDHFASVHEGKKLKPMKEVIEDMKKIQPVVEMNPIKIPKKVNASAYNFCTSR